MNSNKTLEQRARLRAVADYADAYPDEFDMGEWCGTARCAAGTACFLFAKDTYRASLDMRLGGGWKPEYENIDTDIQAVATRLLGLDDREQHILFLHLADESVLPDGLTVPDVMRKMAAGDDIEDVIDYDDYYEDCPGV